MDDPSNDTYDLEEGEEWEQPSRLPVLSREQLALTGGTLLTTGLIDLAVHFNPTTAFFGALATFVVARHSNDILEHLAPWGHDAHAVAERTHRVVEMLMPRTQQPSSGYDDDEPAVPSLMETVPTQPDQATLHDDEAATPVDAAVLLRLGRITSTKQRFDPALNAILGKGVLLAGSQGTGKSNIIGLLAQAAGQCGMPFLVVDYKGEFRTLIEVVPNGILTGHPSLAEEVGSGFFPLTVESADELAAILMEGPFQVVLDVPSYNGDNDEVAQVIAALLHALMDWSRQVRRRGEEPWPCLVITDEAHNFLPQSQSLSALAMKKPTESFALLTSAYSRMANTGRSFGYTLVMATQRLPNISKWSIANLQIKIILAHAEKNDLDTCEKETGGLVDREIIKALVPGAGIVIGLTHEPVMVRFDKQKARHISTTPTVERLQERFRSAPAPRLPQETHVVQAARYEAPRTSMIPALAPLPMKETLPPAAPERETQEHEAQLQRLTPELWEAYHAFTDGMSKQRLARVLMVSPTTAYNRIQALKATGLIRQDGTKVE